jgi:hypothetical protein
MQSITQGYGKIIVILNDAKDNVINLRTMDLEYVDDLINKMFSVKIYSPKEQYDFPIL